MFDFIIQQVLGMQWLSKLIWQLLESGFGATQSSPLWGSLHFFFFGEGHILRKDILRENYG